MAQRRGTFTQGILAGMQTYQRTSAGFRQAESQRLQIENQRRQGQMLQRQYEDYQTPETPEERREAGYADWQRRQDYMRENAPPGAVGTSRGAGEAGGMPPPKMIDIKRANEIVEAMIMDFKDTTGMGDVWPTMVPAGIRDMTTALVRSGQIGRAKGYLYSNYVFSTPEAKKKIEGVMGALGVDASYDEIVSIFTGMQAGISPTGDDERLVKIGNAMREHPKLKEMFVELGSMGFDGIHFEDISPYIEEASALLYPGGKEPSSMPGWVSKLGMSLKQVGSTITSGQTAESPVVLGDRGEEMWSSLKAGVSKVKDWAKQQGRTLFDAEPEIAEEPIPEAPYATPQEQPTEPGGLSLSTPRYDELMQKIQSGNPREEALKRNFEIQSRR